MEDAGDGLRLELLGGLRVSRGGVPLAGLRSRRAAALLVYLAVTGRAHRREALAGLLWGEWPEGAARASVRQALANLRRVVGDGLQTGQSTAGLRPAEVWTDVAAFEALLADPPPGSPAGDGAGGRLAAAVGLYAGDFLAGFGVSDAPAFDDWASGERERLRHLAVGALRRLAMAQAARGEGDAAAAALRRVLTLEPWHEETHRDLMAVLAGTGRRSDALAQYAACRRVLADELGVGPAAETVALAERIRTHPAGAPAGPAGFPGPSAPPAPGVFVATGTASVPPAAPAAPAAVPPGNLPAARTALIGRAGEVQYVRELLAGPPGRPAARLVTVTGAGGVGKTRLALEAAGGLRSELPDGAWLVELAPLDEPALVAATAAVVGARGSSPHAPGAPPEAPGAPPLEALTAFLGDKRLLLLLDNAEHVLVACATLAGRVLDACPGVRLLVTSREPLGILGERQLRVPPLAAPQPGGEASPDDLAGYPAVQLFVERAQAAAPEFRLTRHNAAAVAQLCARLDGIPLALELAAARVRALSVEQLAARLEDRFRLLTGGSRAALPRHQTLRATVDWSHDLLSEDERALFRRLAVFAGGWTLEAAEAVGAGDGVAADEVLDLLVRLVDKSLVQVDQPRPPRGGGARYRLLETLRLYGQERLGAAGETEAVRGRHAAYFLAETEARAAGVSGAARALPEEEFAWFAREHDNLRATLGWLRERGDPERGLRLGAFLGAVWVTQGHLGEERARLAELLALPGARAPTGLRARALVALARLTRRRGDYAAARALFAEALAAARAGGDRQEEVWALFHLANLAALENDLEAAGAGVEAMLAAAEALGDPQWPAAAARLRGLIALQRGEYEAARAHLEAALAAWRARGSRLDAAYVRVSLGSAILGQGDPAGARAHLAEGLTAAREYGDETLVAKALEGFAGLAAAAGDAERAARLAGAAAAVRAGIGVPRNPAAAARLEHDLAPARQALGAERYAAAWARGRATPPEQAVADALEDPLALAADPGSPDPPESASYTSAGR
jgi:predicted ATPase/DNA-binding SARP family transcriptional activator